MERFIGTDRGEVSHLLDNFNKQCKRLSVIPCKGSYAAMQYETFQNNFNP